MTRTSGKIGRRPTAWCSAIFAALSVSIAGAVADPPKPAQPSMAERLRAWAATVPGDRPETRADIAVIADGMCTHLLGAARTMPDANWLRPAILMQEEGDKHPLVLLAVAFLSETDRTATGSTPLYTEAIRALREAKAPNELLLAALRHASSEAHNERQESTAIAHDRLIIDTYLAMVAAPDQVDGSQNLTTVGVDLADDLPADLAADLVKRLDGMPDADACLRETVAGAFEVRAAWNERGYKFASDTSDGQFAKFAARLQNAHARLSKAWKLDPKRAQAPALLITVAMGGGTPKGEGPDVWFKRAVEAQYDYYPTYSKMLTSLLPRWGGSHAEMLDFGQRRMKEARFDTEIPDVYLDALVRVLEDGAELSLLRDPKILTNVERIAEGNKRASKTIWLPWTNMLRVLCNMQLGNYKAARAIIEEPGFSWNAKVAEKVGVTPVVVEREVRAMTCAAREQVKTGKSAFDKGQFDDAARLFSAALKRLEDSQAPESELIALRDLTAMAEMSDAYGRGEWIEQSLRPHLFGWSRLFGSWWCTDGQLRGGSHREAPMLALRTSLGPRFECKCKLREGGRPWLNAEIALFLNYRSYKDGISYRTVSWFPNEHEIRLWGSIANSPIVVKVPGKDVRPVPALDMHIQVWDETIVIKVAGETLYAGPLPDAPVTRGGAFAIGVQRPMPNDATIIVRDFAFHKLSKRPTELDSVAAPPNDKGKEKAP